MSWHKNDSSSIMSAKFTITQQLKKQKPAWISETKKKVANFSYQQINPFRGYCARNIIISLSFSFDTSFVGIQLNIQKVRLKT